MRAIETDAIERVAQTEQDATRQAREAEERTRTERLILDVMADGTARTINVINQSAGLAKNNRQIGPILLRLQRDGCIEPARARSGHEGYRLVRDPRAAHRTPRE
jgi:hypothetical protein